MCNCHSYNWDDPDSGKEQNVLLNEIIRDCAKINKSMTEVNNKLNKIDDNVKKLVSYIMPAKKA